MNNDQYTWFESLKEILLYDLEISEEVVQRQDFENYRTYYEEGLSPRDTAEIVFTERL